MTRLCYICEATSGGVRKHLRLLIECFARPEEGLEVHALLGDRGEPGFKEEVEAWRARGVKAEILPELQREIRFSPDRAAYASIRGRLREIAPQIVHTHGSKSGFLGRLAARAVKVPRILHTPHVFPFQSRGGLAGAFFLLLERYAAQRCDTIVCVGESQREEALCVRLVAPERLLVIPNGVAVPEPLSAEARSALRAKHGLPAEGLIVGMCARLAPQKSVDVFVEAAARAVKAVPNALFVVAGEGPLRGGLQARAAALGLNETRLKLLGHVSDAAELCAAFDVAAMTSHYEGLPYALLEAMAWGVPVAATAVAGSADLVCGGESGLLAPPDDARAIAQNFERLLKDPDLRAKLGQAGRERVKADFSLAGFLDAHRKLYRGSN
ncbi:MAG: glycosyltransferase family 4 protein [Planctomycetes bacterium]|nr:glycosyltransferase family 4 protein [Planctomycetota bacterium]